SDQVALALEIVRTMPTVAEEYRDRFRVVLLDEYQDTSVVQTWLLSELFAGRPVMAVGDPNQSIYGWRGASAANLEAFASQFSASQFSAGQFGASQFGAGRFGAAPTAGGPAGEVRQFTLATS